MSTIHTVETQIDLDFGCYILECIETLRDRGYFVFNDEKQVRDFFGEYDLVEKIKEIHKEAHNKVLYENVSQDYKELYDKLDRVLFYE
jgi:hypothetical protein